MIQKRGVAPLISMVLLIAFAIALISIVINFGFSIVKGQGATCGSDINIEFLEINRQKEACFNPDTSKINLRIKNNGAKNIESLTVTMTGSEDSLTKDLGIGLKPVEEKKFSIAYPVELGELEKIEIVPKVIEDGYPILCQEYAIYESPMRQCERK